MTERVKAGLEGQKVTFGFDAGHDQFNLFGWTARNAGAAWDGELQACVLDDIDYTHIVVGALEDAGFQVGIDAALATALADRVREILADDKAAQARIVVSDRLAAKDGNSIRWDQKDGIRWLAARRRALLGDEMGLGKTMQAAIAVPDNSPVLVVCPATVKGSWAEEFRLWRGDSFATEQLVGRRSFRWPTAGEVLILNYELLPETPPEGCPEGLVLIADEAHYCKGITRRASRFQELAEEVRGNGGRSWVLTGTPMLNRPDELWNVLKAAGLHTMAYGSWRNFVSIYAGSQVRRGGFQVWAFDVDGIDEERAVAGLRRVQLRRDRAQVLPDLPSKIVRKIPVNDLTQRCLRLADKALARLKEEGVDLRDAIMRMGTEMPSFPEISTAREALAQAKTPVLLEMVDSYEEQSQPLVVFSAHTATINLLGRREGWAKIVGGMKAKDRTEIVRQFQAGELRGIAATIGAAGTGITLTLSSNMVFVDQPWSPKLAQQAEDRIARFGQKNTCFIKQLVAAHPLDYRVNELLGIKSALMAKSVEAASVYRLAETNNANDLDTVVGKAEADRMLSFAQSL
jgi:SWI/SNF-related matrix-associated actin-dependent regulator of chromatin subfamily A-like protein 1